MPDEMNEVLQRLTRVETKLDLMITAGDVAKEALASTKSAHHRIEELRQENEKLRQEIEKLRVKQSDSQKFLIGTALSLGGFIIAVVTLAIKFIGP